MDFDSSALKALSAEFGTAAGRLETALQRLRGSLVDGGIGEGEDLQPSSGYRALVQAAEAKLTETLANSRDVAAAVQKIASIVDGQDGGLAKALEGD